MTKKKCEACNGYKINEEAREIKIGGKHIGELSLMPIDDLIQFLSKIMEKEIKTPQGRSISDNILQALNRMVDVGLKYLHLNRSLPTLSGGELQRLSLMTHLDGGLDSLIYILDEPSMSLHEVEKDALIKILIQLKNLGNTVIIVEHDKRFIEIADEIIDIGPGAGINGGTIIFQGKVDTIKKVEESLTGQFLAEKIALPLKSERERRQVD